LKEVGLGAPFVASLALSAQHGFSKQPVERIRLVAGHGVAGDAHCGATVKHRSRVRQNPDQPNLRQVHLLPVELLNELDSLGFPLKPGDLGENVLTRGLDLLALPRGTQLQFPGGATLAITGLRNPCSQIEAFRPGLLSRVICKAADGTIMRRAGVMAVVLRSGDAVVGDRVDVRFPDMPHHELAVV
jgi:MOSC domain-containing protein YiiM